MGCFDCGVSEAWKPMVTSRKDVCFPGQPKPLPGNPHPPPPHLLEAANKVPLIVETGKNEGTVENASCNNRHSKALNNIEVFAEEQTNIHRLVI